MTERLPSTKASPTPAPDEFWDGGGFWLGPRDLRFFLRHNRGFVPLYVVLFTALACLPIWESVPHFLAPLATLGLAAVMTFLLAWGYSRGWIGPGDGDA
jgi:hypothetical protein